MRSSLKTSLEISLKKAGLPSKKRAAILCIGFLLMCQAAFFAMPRPVYAEPAGETLIVRVQYAMEREDTIREKARFTKSQLNAMNASTLRYTNVTDVGTVLAIIARGPKLSAIIEAAGIDSNSIKHITFRTTDGTGEHQRYGRNFSVSQHLTAARYYYPKLQQNYERHEDNTLTPLTGSLRNRTQVPSILAVESFSTKQPSKIPEPSDMTGKESYRFCLGQTALAENVKTRPGYGGGDVTAMESTESIFGMDITLYGSPVKGISLALDSKTVKVGSKKKISPVIEGDQLFQEDWGFDVSDLKWSSSDETIAAVDQQGVITVKKQGEVTITATAPNGMTASITINAKEDGKQENQPPAAAAAGGSQDKKPSSKAKAKAEKKPAGIVVKEVKIGGVIEEHAALADAGRQDMEEDAQALDEAKDSDPKAVLVSVYTSALVFGFGIVFRIRRYMKEV